VSADETRRYVVAYDVSSDPRRVRIAHTLQSYGDRVQYSVFLVDAKPSRMLRLQARLAALLDHATDSVLICDLGPRDAVGRSRMATIGAERTYTGAGPLIL